MAWIDAEGVVHSVWVYEPRRHLGPVLAQSIDAATLDELQAAADDLSEVMINMLDDLGAELEVSSEQRAESTADLDLPEDMVIETSDRDARLSAMVTAAVMQTQAKWRVEVLNAINDVIHDLIDEKRGVT